MRKIPPRTISVAEDPRGILNSSSLRAGRFTFRGGGESPLPRLPGEGWAIVHQVQQSSRIIRSRLALRRAIVYGHGARTLQLLGHGLSFQISSIGCGYVALSFFICWFDYMLGIRYESCKNKYIVIVMLLFLFLSPPTHLLSTSGMDRPHGRSNLEGFLTGSPIRNSNRDSQNN